MTAAYMVPRVVQGNGPELLQEWRKARKMSQAELACRLRVAQGTLSLYERGLRYPLARALRGIARMCRIPSSEWGVKRARWGSATRSVVQDGHTRERRYHESR